MRLLCGEAVSCNRKVAKQAEGYDAVGVRRLLCKWVENMTTNNKKICRSKAFHNFFGNKKKAFDHFRMTGGGGEDAITIN